MSKFHHSHSATESGNVFNRLQSGTTTPETYARLLLRSLGRHDSPLPAHDSRPAHWLWAQSGAMWLTGQTDGPARACSAPIASCAQGAWLALSALCPEQLDPDFEAFRLLGERAAIAGLGRRGRISPGGACRLIDTADGMIALNLARDADHELLHAWLEQPVAEQAEISAVVAKRSANELIQRARLLGLAAATLTQPRLCTRWFRHTRLAPPAAIGHTPLVIDLSTLWAGPLAGALLAQCGARVIKLESLSRPDGARSGPAAFFDLLNADKESVVLDIAKEHDRARLTSLLLCADIVIESSRPRALEQMGIHAADIVAANPGLVWLAISGYGRESPSRDWIAYGDDAGVAAGLSWVVGNSGFDPVFCADAIADPLTGLHAALAGFAAWQSGGGLLIDIALHDVTAWCINAGVDDSLPEESAIAEPRARVPSARAARAGADTDRVLREFINGAP